MDAIRTHLLVFFIVLLTISLRSPAWSSGAPEQVSGRSAETVFGISTFVAAQGRTESLVEADLLLASLDIYASLAQWLTRVDPYPGEGSLSRGIDRRIAMQRDSGQLLSQPPRNEPSGWIMVLAAFCAIGFVIYRRYRSG